MLPSGRQVKIVWSPYLSGMRQKLRLQGMEPTQPKSITRLAVSRLSYLTSCLTRRLFIQLMMAPTRHLTMFVADAAGDLSAGTLYAARFYQTSNGSLLGAADVEWISLGHAPR